MQFFCQRFFYFEKKPKNPTLNIDDPVKSPVLVIARSSAFAGRRSNPVFSGTYKSEIASL